jgi:NADH:ubiquinone oxidoreductase subunit 2 (subunit N)
VGQAAGAVFAGDTLPVLGRSFQLEAPVRSVILALVGGVTALLLLSARFPQGRAFGAGALLLLSPMAAALMVEPPLFGALFLLLAAALAALLIQGEQAGSTAAAVRSLLTAALAVPLLLVAGWMLGVDQASFMATIGRLVPLALVILFAGFPFHIWVGPAVAEAPRLTPALVFGLLHLVVALFAANLVAGAPWLGQNAHFTQLISLLGGATIGAAILLAAHAATFSRLLAHSLLLDIGAGIVAFLGSSGGEQSLIWLFGARFVALLLAGIGLALLQPYLRSDRLGRAAGLVWQAPLAVALFGYGVATLAGLPLTPGFAPRWALIGQLGSHSPLLAALLLVGAASSVAGLLRGLAIWLAPTGQPAHVGPEET